MVAWGIVMTLMCLCDNYHDLIMYVLLSFTLGFILILFAVLAFS